MSKDFAKEYKDAVVNDLPDLWDRIEAALPADVNAVSDNETSDNASTPVSAPVAPEKPKKKKKKLVWLYAVIPAAAIILVVIIPLGALLTAGVLGMTSKTASNSMPAAADASMAYSDSAAFEASEPMGEASSFDEDVDELPAVPESIDDVLDPSALKGSDSVQENAKNLLPQPVLPGAANAEEEEQLMDIGNGYLLANAKMKIKVDGTYVDDAIGVLAEFTILEADSKNNEVYAGFSGFKAGECGKAKPEGFNKEPKAGDEFEVSIYLYAPGDYWVIRPAD